MDATVDLGGHPAWNVLKGVAIALLITVLIVAGVYLLVNKTAGGVVGAIAVVLWGLFAFRLPGMFIGALINSGIYKKARKLVAEGKLLVSYVGRDSICEGFTVVDEQNQCIYVNGHLYNFSDVRSIHSKSRLENSTAKHYVEIVVKQGVAPLHKVCFNNEHSATTFYHRLANTLGLA